MAQRPPRQIVHRGVVEAAAILVDEALAGPGEARRRIVAAWAPGAVVHRLGAGLLLRFSTPRFVDCARAPGLPLVRTSADPAAPLASAPLAPDELAAAAPPPGSVVLVRGGALTVIVPAEADREDPAGYLDLDAFAEVRAEPLGAPPPPPEIVCAPTNAAARELLGVAAAPREQAQIAAALAAIAGGRAPSGTAAAAPNGGRALSFLATFAAAIASILGRFFAAPSSAARDGRALAAAPAAPAGPSFRDRLSARMRTWIAQMLVRARLAHLVGRRQAEYLGRLLDMIDRGDLDAALRHAIPLGGEDGGGPVAPALGVPTPRSDLAISLGRSGPSAAMVAATDLYAHLRAKYRAVFERLEREGRLDEAAFVLAELLHEDEEAVAFLERHGRLRLAAELAEARMLAPGLVVRQWFLAGDVARALRLARRHGAFADALVRLGKHERAVELRLRWAEQLAEAGDFAAAVDVIWPVESARGLGAAWIDHAIAQGGASAARMLAKKLALVPASFADVREKVLALLADDGPRAPLERRAFAEALVAGSASAEARTLARPALRALVHDGARSADFATQQLASRLLAFTDDGAMRADMPAWPAIPRPALAQIPTSRTYAVAAHDTGAVPILDAAYLPNGRVAAALGEAGVRVIGRDGKTMFHLDQPAHYLVISDRGDRAIAVAWREGITRLARLDLVGRRSEPWCEAPRLDGATADFDGAHWVVVSKDKLLAIDVLDTGLSTLASLDLGGRVWLVAIARSATSCALFGSILESDPVVRWRYDVPSWTLRMRAPVAATADPVKGDVVAVNASGAVAAACRDESGVVLVHHGVSGTVREHRLTDDRDASPRAVILRDAWVACAVRHRDRVEVHLIDEAQLFRRALITLGGAMRASLRLSDDALTIADNRGRVLVIDLAHGGLIHDLRV